jgi:hypothetical protein
LACLNVKNELTGMIKAKLYVLHDPPGQILIDCRPSFEHIMHVIPSVKHANHSNAKNGDSNAKNGDPSHTTPT